MLRVAKFLVIAAVLSWTPAVSATPVSFTFNSALGVLGTSQSYTNNSITITAYGFSGPSTPTNLFGKNDGGDEVGLGIAGAAHNEIQTGNFVQLDLLNFWVSNPSSVMMSIGSVQEDEGWDIHGSNVLGTLGATLQSGTTNYPTAFALVAGASSFRYIGVQASALDVLVSTLSGETRPPQSIPEPGSLSLLLSALGGAPFMLLRRRRAVR